MLAPSEGSWLARSPDKAGQAAQLELALAEGLQLSHPLPVPARWSQPSDSKT